MLIDHLDVKQQTLQTYYHVTGIKDLTGKGGYMHVFFLLDDVLRYRLEARIAKPTRTIMHQETICL